MAVLMLVNFGRSWADPAGFAKYMGLPLDAAATAAGAAWVKVYGLRALFIGLLVAYLLWQRSAATLRAVAALALVMSAGDAWLAQAAVSPAWVRHVIISVVLIAAAWARWSRTWPPSVARRASRPGSTRSPAITC
jgi:hypothetical protein